MSKKRNVRKNSRVSKKGGTKNTLRTTKPLTLSKGGDNSNKPIATMNNLNTKTPQPPINLTGLSPGGTKPSEPLNKVTPPTPPIQPKSNDEETPPVDTDVALPKKEEQEQEKKNEEQEKKNEEQEKKDTEEKQLEEARIKEIEADEVQAKIEVEKTTELETQLEKLKKGLDKLTNLLQQTDETQNDAENPNKKKFIQALISITELSIDDLKNNRDINHWENTKNALNNKK